MVAPITPLCRLLQTLTDPVHGINFPRVRDNLDCASREIGLLPSPAVAVASIDAASVVASAAIANLTAFVGLTNTDETNIANTAAARTLSASRLSDLQSTSLTLANAVTAFEGLPAALTVSAGGGAVVASACSSRRWAGVALRRCVGRKRHDMEQDRKPAGHRLHCAKWLEPVCDWLSNCKPCDGELEAHEFQGNAVRIAAFAALNLRFGSAVALNACSPCALSRMRGRTMTVAEYGELKDALNAASGLQLILLRLQLIANVCIAIWPSCGAIPHHACH